MGTNWISKNIFIKKIIKKKRKKKEFFGCVKLRGWVLQELGLHSAPPTGALIIPIKPVQLLGFTLTQNMSLVWGVVGV
jgi:hypothetical protein